MTHRKDPSGQVLLALAHQSVTQLRIDNAVTLCLSGGAVLRIEQSFVVGALDHEDLVVPEGDPPLLAPVLKIARSTVERGVALSDGGLDLRFSDGAHLFVPADADFEAWELSDATGLRVVSGPGPRLTTWSSPPPGTTT